MDQQSQPTSWNTIKPVSAWSLNRFRRCAITGDRLGLGNAIEVCAIRNGKLTHRWFLSESAYSLASWDMPTAYKQVADHMIAVLTDLEDE